MSRTLKDRPYWVKNNDPKIRREASHGCGTPARHREFLVDDEGQPVYKTRTFVEQEFRSGAAKNEGVTEAEAEANYPKYRHLYRKTVKELYSSRIVITTYDDEPQPCTIDEPCSPLSYQKTCQYYHERDNQYAPRKEFRRIHHKRERGHAKISLTEMGKEYNTTQTVNEDVTPKSLLDGRKWWN